MKIVRKLIAVLMAGAVAFGAFAAEKTPFAKHGKLSVVGTDLVDKNGEPYQLYGMSTHGIAWYPQYVNEQAFTELRDVWNTNCIRLALYTYEYNGYCTGGNQNTQKQYVFKGIDLATKLGMYVIVDWHVLNDRNPEIYEDEAIAFFSEVSKKYAKNNNILYEICNEPNGSTSWSDVYSYAEKVIPVIRKNNKNAVIIVGTPSWCQKIEDAVDFPLDYDNLMYAVHFYANTHKSSFRNKVESAIISGLPVFVSEFGTCNASGDGGFNSEESDAWLEFLDEYNISYMNWSFCNKNETASVFKSTCRKSYGFTEEDLSESGKYIYDWYRKKEQ